jgi:competence protein ComEC
MTNTTALYFFRKMPFCRLLAAFVTGILLQYQLQFSFSGIVVTGLVAGCFLPVWLWLPPAIQFRWRWLQGIAILFLIIAAGAAVTRVNDVRHQPQWYGRFYKPKMWVAATLSEPLTPKARSWKALAQVTALYVQDRWQPVTGQLLVYCKKESDTPPLPEGAAIVFQQPLRNISGMGNPGAFDYAGWCALKNLYHQVYLQQKEIRVLQGQHRNVFRQWLSATRAKVMALLHRQIPDAQAAALAGALLIGYREELDKDLVLSYTTTGVVHIIAISGLHLGLIYGLLVLVLGRFPRLLLLRWLQPVLVLSVLWLFTLLAGAVPSILRSAVMFSFIVVGQASGKRHNLYNNLAASAFCLLAYDPFYLWDVGFQLSYSAVLGIALLYRPLYHWPGFQNRVLCAGWQLVALSMAAQLLTLPVLLYRFHQFPNYFLVSNFVAVPLSALILYLEIGLLVVSGLPSLAAMAGKTIETLIDLLNGFIRYMAQFPFAVTGNIQLSGLQVLLLYLFIACCCYSLLHKKSSVGVYAMFLLAMLCLLQTVSIVQSRLQQKLVVYNVPGQTALELVHGRRSYLVGEAELLQHKALQQQYLQPAHRLWRVQQTDLLPIHPLTIVSYAGKRVALLSNQSFRADSFRCLPVDILILCHNPEMPLARLCTLFDCRRVVFAASNSLWKIQNWKKDCDSLHLRFHSVPEQGAFVMEL